MLQSKRNRCVIRLFSRTYVRFSDQVHKYAFFVGSTLMCRSHASVMYFFMLGLPPQLTLILSVQQNNVNKKPHEIY